MHYTDPCRSTPDTTARGYQQIAKLIEGDISYLPQPNDIQRAHLGQQLDQNIERQCVEPRCHSTKTQGRLQTSVLISRILLIEMVLGKYNQK